MAPVIDGRVLFIFFDGLEEAAEPLVRPTLTVGIEGLVLPVKRVLGITGESEVVVPEIGENGRLPVGRCQNMTIGAEALGVEEDKASELSARLLTHMREFEREEIAA